MTVRALSALLAALAALAALGVGVVAPAVGIHHAAVSVADPERCC
ncbi:MAG TPA: hypothetical protein VH857_01460 [Actinomycetes bacterium]|jgi:hypothetical protein|nr:hypothetical protein [Actinomycetes bacterium]